MQNQNCVPGSVPKLGEVPGIMGEMEKLIGDLEDRVQILRDKLQPVLLDTPTPTAQGCDKAVFGSPMGQWISGKAGRIACLNEQISDLIDRLAL